MKHDKIEKYPKRISGELPNKTKLPFIQKLKSSKKKSHLLRSKSSLTLRLNLSFLLGLSFNNASTSSLVNSIPSHSEPALLAGALLGPKSCPPFTTENACRTLPFLAVPTIFFPSKTFATFHTHFNTSSPTPTLVKKKTHNFQEHNLQPNKERHTQKQPKKNTWKVIETRLEIVIFGALALCLQKPTKNSPRNQMKHTFQNPNAKTRRNP